MTNLIVEMDMPKKERFCELQCADLYCIKTSKKCNVFDTGERPSWCPIKGVLPEEHDRLVREKDVRWAIDDIVLEIASRTGCVAMTKDETMEYVKRLPTIIAAERKEK